MSVQRSRHGSHVAPMRAAAVALGVVLAAAALAAAWIIRSPLPKLDGTVRVAGISSAVTIIRDKSGVAHIHAQTSKDAFFGQGFACAQDRLWQMDLLRREADGTLSQIFGRTALPVDTYYRTLGFADLAKRSLLAAAPEDREALDAYAAGVNAAATGHGLPLEFRLLGYAPDPWTAADSLAVGLLITRSQDDNWQTVLLRGDLIAKVGKAGALALLDEQVIPLEEFVPGYAARAGGAGVARANPASGTASAQTLAGLFAAPGVAPPGPTLHQGSNNWAVAGTKTTTGKPVLSNDTHLDHTLPSTWWLAHVEGGDLDVEGFSLPGVPGVIIGHNRRIAFGVTSAAEDVEDLFVERFASPASDEYRADGRWLRAAHRVERIPVKGGGDVTVDVLVTRHGPIIKRSGDVGLALAWTVLRDGLSVAVVHYDRAGDFAQFRAALSGLIGPTLNFAYADVDGHVGYQDAGRVPLRAAGDGSVPVEGEDDRYAWKGEVPFAELPHALDPKRGFVASANNEIVRPDYAPVLSRDFLAPYRIHEIVRRLSMPGRHTPQEIGEIQGDAFDYPRSQLAAAAAKALSASSAPADRQAASLLAGWDGVASVDATAPTFVVAIESELERRLLAPRLGPELRKRYDKDHRFITPLIRALDGDASLRSLGITRASVLAALLPAAHDAEAALGYPAQPLARWGDRNAAIYSHPLAVKWPLTLLSAPTVPQRGDDFAVFQSRPDFGPSMRLVADTADWDASSMLLTLGESGVWTDQHYVDMERAWVDVGWNPTPFSDDAVTSAAVDSLQLVPSP